jgi:hypothetical protein
MFSQQVKEKPRFMQLAKNCMEKVNFMKLPANLSSRINKGECTYGLQN